MANYNENDGVWRTVRGRRVFIRKGESLDSAMKRSGKFDNLKHKKDSKFESKDKIEDKEPDFLKNATKEEKENYYKNIEEIKKQKEMGPYAYYLKKMRERGNINDEKPNELQNKANKVVEGFRKQKQSNSGKFETKTDKEKEVTLAEKYEYLKKKGIDGFNNNTKDDDDIFIRKEYDRQKALERLNQLKKEGKVDSTGTKAIDRETQKEVNKLYLDTHEPIEKHFAGEELYSEDPNRFGNKTRSINEKMNPTKNDDFVIRKDIPDKPYNKADAVAQARREVAQENKYADYLEKTEKTYDYDRGSERASKIASNNGYKVGDRVQIQDSYSGKYKGDYEVVGELDKKKSQMLYGNAVKGYIVKDKFGETTTNDYRMKRIENDIPKSMLKNSKELSDIAKRTGGTSLTSEAGRKWNKLYKEDKNNIAYDLGDNYSARLGYNGDISIQSSHPYNDTQYSYAKANIDNGKISDWKVTIPGGGIKIVKSKTEALNLMKNADEWINSGKKVKSFEGITNTYTPKTTFEEFMKKKKSNNGK